MVDTQRRKVDIYLKIYSKALTYLSPEAETMAKKHEPLYFAWTKMKDFLIKSVKQLEDLNNVGQWEKVNC